MTPTPLPPSQMEMWRDYPSPSAEELALMDCDEDSFEIEASLLSSPTPARLSLRPSLSKMERKGDVSSQGSSRTSSTSSSLFSQKISRQSSVSSLATSSTTASTRLRTEKSLNITQTGSHKSIPTTLSSRRRDDPGVPISSVLLPSSNKRRRVDTSLPTPDSGSLPRTVSRQIDDTLPTFSKDGTSIVRERHVTPPTSSAIPFYRPESPKSPSPKRLPKIDSRTGPLSSPHRTPSSKHGPHSAQRVNGTPVILDSEPPLPAPNFETRRSDKAAASVHHTTPASNPSAAYVTPTSTAPSAPAARPALPTSPSPSPKKAAPAEQHIPSYDLLIGETPMALDTEIIAFDQKMQSALDEKQISWPVQLEVYRGITLGLWRPSDALNRIGKLVGKSEDIGPNVAMIMLNRADRPKPGASASIFAEYDREDTATLEGHGRGLGLMGAFQGVENWYGGRIQQIVRREMHGGKARYILEPPEMKRSNRVARFMGSRRVLELRIPKSERFGVDTKSLAKKFVLAGRVFVPFDAKDGKIYMVETDEDYQRTPTITQGDTKRISFRQFVQWHNCLSRNFKQPTSKWVTRFDLGLSTSVPACEFCPENICYIPDINAAHHSKDIPTEKCLTDGCGFVSYSALVAIRERVGLVEVPTAVQGRVAGGKGLFIRYPGDDDPKGPLKVWLRASQHKIKLGDLAVCDRSQRIFDLVAPARVTQPARLSTQLLLNYSANDVPNDVILSWFKETIKQDVEPLMRFGGTGWRELLYDAIHKAGNLSGMRLQRLAGANGRALGISSRFEKEESEHDSDNEDDYPAAPEKSLAPLGEVADAGPPESPFEKALYMVSSGFCPSEEPYLHDLMRTIVKMTLNSLLDKYHVVIPRSAEMFIIPDPTKTLKPRQIHVRFSRAVADPTTGIEMNTILGPVLVSRNPTRIASDVQKVEAVEIPDCPELAKYTNVIIMSTHPDCPRSLASYLGGGDYDGDTAMVLWEPSIVNVFKNHDFIPMPESAMSRFSVEPERIASFYARLIPLTPRDRQLEVVRALLGGLGDRKVGQYSELHEIRSYYYGYNDPETITLAYLFCICLDSHKSGHRLIADKFEADSRAYRKQKPPCMQPRDLKEWDGADKTGGYLLRPNVASKVPHVLDAIRYLGNKLNSDCVKMLDDLRRGVKIDTQLSAMFTAARADAQVLSNKGLFPEYLREFDIVNRHVLRLHNRYKDEMAKYAKQASAGKKDDAVSRKTSKIVREIAREYTSQPEGTPVSLELARRLPAADRLLRASYAYYLASSSVGDNKAARFAFEVAFKDLCRIKAESHSEGWRPIVNPLSDILVAQRSALQILSAQATI